MTKTLPYLALDSSGKRTILNDYSLPMSGGKTTTEKETVKMKKTLAADQLSRYVWMRIRNPAAADRYWEKCMGRNRNIAVDAAMDDETAEKLKGFLKSRLSADEQVCNMLSGDVEAQDTEPPPGGTEPPAKFRGAAEDSKADFDRRFPGLAHIRQDNSGIQPRKPPASGADVASFNAMFPGLAHIRQA